MFEPLRLKISHTNLVREGKQHLLDDADENCKYFYLLPDLAFPPTRMMQHLYVRMLVCKDGIANCKYSVI
jgi:hypothetical protein